MHRVLFLPVVAALLMVPGGVFGADPQPYTVTLRPTGDAALDQALHDASQLEVLREKAPVGPFALVIRARDDAGRFQTVLDSFGYYASKVAVTVDGRQLDESDLPDLLRQAPADPPAIEVTVLGLFQRGADLSANSLSGRPGAGCPPDRAAPRRNRRRHRAAGRNGHRRWCGRRSAC